MENRRRSILTYVPRQGNDIRGMLTALAMRVFQPTLAAKGVTCNAVLAHALVNISTHTPTKGVTDSRPRFVE